MMTRAWIVALGAALAFAGTADAAASKKAKHPAEDAQAPAYGRDVITVTANDRHGVLPTATCLVWANAEGLGVGPEQLNGFHGVNMTLNPHPLPSEADQKGVSFDQGLANLKAQYPTTPAWLVAALQKSRGKIESACSEEHPEPFLITKLTAKDKTAG